MYDLFDLYKVFLLKNSGLHRGSNPRPLAFWASVLPFKQLPGMQEVVGSNPRGGRNFSHGKLSKINPLVLKSH